MKKRFLIPLILPLILITIIATGYGFRDQIKQLSIFHIKEITLSKTEHYTPEQLLKQISPDRVQSIFDVDLEEIKFQLKKHPWIKNVLISRIFPDKISVQIVEHQIRGVVLLDHFYYYNHDHQIFMITDQSALKNYPVFTGLSRENYLSKFHLFQKNLQEMEQIVITSQKNIPQHQINEIRRTKFKGYEVVLNSQDRVVLGNKDFDQNLKRAGKIITLMKQKNQKIALILFNEFKNPDKVVVKLKKEQL